MTLTLKSKNNAINKIPSALHINNTGRIQSVNKKDNKLFYNLIKRFGKITGVNALINTSFNTRGEPIVCTPQDAYSCFKKSGMDYLVIGNFLVSKQ